jgi:O-antigen ligase
MTTEEFNQALLDTGSMTTPQFYLVGLILLLAIPPRQWAVLIKHTPWVWGLALLISGFGLLIHFKRGTWLAFAFAVVLLSLLRQNRRILSALLLGVALILAIPATRDRVKDMATMLNPNKGDRAALWSRVAPPLLREHPWGYGYKAMRPRDLQAYHPVQPKLNHLHNNVLQIAGELGWLGGGFWTAWMLAAWGSSLAAVRRAAGDSRTHAAGVCAAFTGLLANGMVEYNFGDTEILMLFALLLGMIARSSAPPEPVDVAGKGT